MSAISEVLSEQIFSDVNIATPSPASNTQSTGEYELPDSLLDENHQTIESCNTLFNAPETKEFLERDDPQNDSLSPILTDLM